MYFNYCFNRTVEYDFTEIQDLQNGPVNKANLLTREQGLSGRDIPERKQR